MTKRLLALLLVLAPCLALAAPKSWTMYVGTFTRGTSKGIYAFRFDGATGKMTPLGLVAETASPTWLVIHRNQRFLYAVNEVNEYQGAPAGSVTAFAIDPATGALKAINTVSSKGPGPCYVALDKTNQWLFVANYAGGSVAAFPVHPNGSLGEASAFYQHTGSSVGPRQAGPHAHITLPTPDNRFVLTADLGLDEVLIYRLDPKKGGLAPGDPPYSKTMPGSGPRHVIFHPNGKIVYTINEIASTIVTSRYNKADGRLTELQTVSTLPKGFTGNSTTAEIVVHPSGKFLYGSNRGDDSIAVFTIDATTGTLTATGLVPTQGKTPRNIALDPSGNFLLAANQDTGNIVVFRIDPSTGALTPTGEVQEVPFPVCLVFGSAASRR